MKLVRDPLVVFLLIGGGLFLLNSLLSPEAEDEAPGPNTIQVTNEVLAVLEDEWSARWNRPPTEDEFEGLIDAYIKEEILFREALKLGLDQSDSIIRRRLAQKMEFLTSDIADLEEVTDESLESYYEENADRYREEAEFGFRHLFFSPEKRNEAEADAKEVAEQLESGAITFDQAIDSSDRMLLAPEFAKTSVTLLGRQFGESFAKALLEADAEEKRVRAMPSNYGFHAVEIIESSPARIPELESVREKVLADYRYDKREALNRDMLDSLLEQYEVIIGDPAEPDKDDES